MRYQSKKQENAENQQSETWDRIYRIAKENKTCTLTLVKPNA